MQQRRRVWGWSLLVGLLSLVGSGEVAQCGSLAELVEFIEQLMGTPPAAAAPDMP